jgi:hypothetical protein
VEAAAFLVLWHLGKDADSFKKIEISNL